MTTKTADIYLRLSDLRPCDACRAAGQECQHDSLDAKEKLLREKASQLGWGIHRVVIENDQKPPGRNGRRRPASAFKRERVRNKDGSPATGPDGEPLYRVLRPGFRSILRDFISGQANAVLAEDLDRACRDPRDLEDLIDIAEAHHISARSLSGSLTFTDGGTDGEITMARVMVTMGNKSSRDTARRVAQARERRAGAGRNGGGRRPYGFRSVKGDLSIDPAEAAEIRRWAEAVLAAPVSHADRSRPELDDGLTLKSLARDLREREVPTATGTGQWRPETLRAILVRPMTGGLSVHQGEIADVPAGQQPAWMTDPILPPDVWQAVVDRLTDPARTTTTGNAVKWLGSGIYRCGKCDDGTICHVTGSDGRPRYVCSGPVSHLGRTVGALDEFVTAHLIERLARPDAVSLLAPAPAYDTDAPALRRELRVHQARLTAIARDYDDDLITREQMKTMTASRRAKISAIQALLDTSAAASADPLEGIAGRPDAAEVWDGLTLEQHRAILRRIAVVTLLPAGRGRGFDTSTVRIDPLTTQV